VKTRQKILDFKNASIGYRKNSGDTVLLNDLSLSLREGEFTGLIGRNGSGKSTLLRTAARLHDPLSGSILLDGRNIKDIEPSELATLVAFVPSGTGNTGIMTVRELVGLGRFPYTNWVGRLTGTDRDIVEDSLGLVNISHLADRKLFEISDGERQKAIIARTLAQKTRIIILDEPTAFLDLPSRYEIIDLLHELTGKGISVIYSTHDLNIALRLSDKLWLIKGQTIAEGAPEDLILDGSFAGIFDSEKIKLNPLTGDFDLNVTSVGCIRLICDDPVIYHWTKLALLRSGFEVTNNESVNARIEAQRKGDKIIWNFQRFNENLFFDSIYELLSVF
jgi:iron complex transport system ATP-binding protein